MKPAVLVLGSGPIRIGQGIEFDYSCVHCAWALQRMGYRAILLNNNPETVSTDFDTGDGLYFEPAGVEEVLAVVEREKPIGVVTQFGGQTAINLAQPLHDQGVRVLGSSAETIALAEDRRLFDALLEELGIPRPVGQAVTSLSEAREAAARIGYPVLVRPSFVLGGRAMEICRSEAHLERFYGEAEAANPGLPVLIDSYLFGDEAELDVISDGEECFVPGIMEHVERAGVHSGDSMAVFPPIRMDKQLQADLVLKAATLCRALKIRGLMNIQYVVKDGKPFVIEVNPRASRTVPFLSKVTGIPMVDIATRCAMGQSLRDMGYEGGLWVLEGGPGPSGSDPAPYAGGRIIPEADIAAGTFDLPDPILYAVKAPVFSFQKLSRVEPSLGPEMKSTGEIIGIDRTYEAALYKAMAGGGIVFKDKGDVVITLANADKAKGIAIAREAVRMGFTIAATAGTHQTLAAEGIEARLVGKIQDGSPNLLDLIVSGSVCLMINTPEGDSLSAESLQIRRACIESGVACVTNIDTAAALANALKVYQNPMLSSCLTLDEYLGIQK